MRFKLFLYLSTADSKSAMPAYHSSGPSNAFPRSHSQVKVTSPSGSIRSSSVRSASMQSASVRSTVRHQSLAQKLRSTSKSVKGNGLVQLLCILYHVAILTAIDLLSRLHEFD